MSKKIVTFTATGIGKNQLTYPMQRINETTIPTNISIDITTIIRSNVPTTKQPNYNYGELLGGGFYLRPDINDPDFKGYKIFKSFNSKCYKEYSVKKPPKNKYLLTIAYRPTSTRNVQKVAYDLAATGTRLSGKCTGGFTMGTTINIKTNRSSSGSVDITGSSIEISTVRKAFLLDKNCYKSLIVPFTDEYLVHADLLETIIGKAWLSENWKQYVMFLKQFGSHIAVKAMGIDMQQWRFAKTSVYL